MFSINIVGDIVFPSYMDLENYKIDHIKQYLPPKSINIGNLEAPILYSLKTINKERLQRKKIIMYSQRESISFLKKLSINVLTLANNHIFDFGYEGFNQTTENLNNNNNNNIKWFGAGKNFMSSIKPLVIEKNNIRISFIGIGWSIIESVNSKKNKYGGPSINHNYLSFISHLKKKIDFLIVYFHWGYEHERFPLPYHI